MDVDSRSGRDMLIVVSAAGGHRVFDEFEILKVRLTVRSASSDTL
jgi:hypothetical protein